ncbi:unnamed protein product, partial [Ectocarpus sp. 12 AP-2014]
MEARCSKGVQCLLTRPWVCLGGVHSVVGNVDLVLWRWERVLKETGCMIVKRPNVLLDSTLFLLLPVHVIPTMKLHLAGEVRACVLGCLALHTPGDHADLGGVSSKLEYSSRQNTANG